MPKGQSVSMLGVSLSGSVHSATILICFALCFAYTLSVFFAFEVRWRSLIQSFACGPAAMASGATVRRYPRFGF